MKRIKRVIGIICSLSLIGPDIAAANSIEISGEDLFVPQRIASSAKLSFEDGQFTAILDGKSRSIQKDDIRDLPKDLTVDQLTGFINSGGYLALGQIGDDLSLTGKLRLRGGINPLLLGAGVAIVQTVIKASSKPKQPQVINNNYNIQRVVVKCPAAKPKPKHHPKPKRSGKKRR